MKISHTAHSRWPDPVLALSAGLLVLGAILTSPHGRFSQVEVLHQFWLGIGIMGGGFVMSWRLTSVPAVWFWGVAILTRLILLPMEPGDDVWRYLWEGHIQNLGYSPYHVAPNAAELVPYRTDWWAQINHPEVSAIYPPITQISFRGLAAIAPNVYLFKIAFGLADLALCWLLSRRFGAAQTTLYAWNPMILYSFVGGAHYDSWFILPLVAAWLVIDPPEGTQSPGEPSPFRLVGGALLIGISAAVKWISLPLLGWLIWQPLRRRNLWSALAIALVGVMPMLLSALPFCGISTCPLVPTDSAFVVYGRSAEFIPHWVAQVWPLSLKANWIFGIPLMVWIGWLIVRTDRFQPCAEGYGFGVLLLSPIVHFWYFTWVVPFAVSSQNWGVRLVSLSGFVYFVLPSRLPDWRLTDGERLVLWLPFILGGLWTLGQHYRKSRRGSMAP